MNSPPKEDEEAKVFAAWARHKGLLFEHIPNEIRAKHPGYLKKRAQMGVSKGSPDYRIYERHPLPAECPGVAFELKRIKGGKVSPEQKQWLQALGDQGWVTFVAYGAADAIARLEEIGY